MGAAIETIICPRCGEEIPLTEALLARVRGNIEADLETRYNQRLEAERETLRKEAQEDVGIQLTELKNEVQEKSEKLKQAQENELRLREERRLLEEGKEALKLEVSRRIDEEVSKIKGQYDLRDREKEEVIHGLRREVAELQRRLEQAPPQIRGEVLERSLEDILVSTFRTDQIEPVPRGTRGADVIQRVIQAGQRYGTIIWESKRRRTWSNSWIDKLKENQRRINAEIAIIATTALPSDINQFGFKDGVWVTCFPVVCEVATLLRQVILEVGKTKLALTGRGEKIEAIYEYLLSTAFNQKVEAIVEAVVSMKQGLDDEKRAMEKLWARREQEIWATIKGIAGMYGDMQGIIGPSLPKIERLELPAAREDLEEK